MNQYEAEIVIARIQKLHMSGDDKEAVKQAQKMLGDNLEDRNVRFAVSGLFIDLGAVLGDMDVVDKGIVLIQDILEENNPPTSDENVFTGKYNLSNGYYTRYHFLQKQGESEKALDELRKAKDCLQDVLLGRSKLPDDLLSKATANYANILDHFGRTIEAVDYYYDTIDVYPNNAVAMANCGIAIRKLINISHNHAAKNLYEAWSLLTKACDEKDDVELYAGPAAYSYFKTHLDSLSGVIEDSLKGGADKSEGGVDKIKKYAEHRIEKHGTPEAESWLAIINHDRLLLTLNQNPLNSEYECVDDLYFNNLITPVGRKGVKRFRDLAHSLNMLKEDYSTARYLYYHSINAGAPLNRYSKLTKFADALDNSSFSVEMGLLKACFRIAADCLDKVAILVNEFLELHPHGTQKLNINNIWYKKHDHKRGLLSIVEHQLKINPFFKALKELQADWFLENFPGPLKGIRDTATHLKFIIYESRFGDFSSNAEEWNTEEEFPKYARILLRTTKAAIIYTVCAMNFQETNGREDDDSSLLKRTFRLD